MRGDYLDNIEMFRIRVKAKLRVQTQFHKQPQVHGGFEQGSDVVRFNMGDALKQQGAPLGRKEGMEASGTDLDL